MGYLVHMSKYNGGSPSKWDEIVAVFVIVVAIIVLSLLVYLKAR